MPFCILYILTYDFKKKPWSRNHFNAFLYEERGRRAIGISGSLMWSRTQMELIFNPCGEFRWSPEGPVSQIHSPHLLVGAPGIVSDLIRFVQMLKRVWGVESNRKLPHLSIPIKTAAWVSEFAVEDLPLSRTAALVPEFAGRICPWAEHWWWWWSKFQAPTIFSISYWRANFVL